ncbi:oxidoreductase, short-chain dehydrogenase/reductase family protein [Oceanicola granulosus HTCC2516]|uniref:Oxidoreductase, short-chain dehydrogenase/reductase family protein n=1 Tax=Oceanicola granulosus (strain ATCC BAA-861 / DSM 15982 / KCTC 12143 / HTCC2516) TaxID=314256 RepID=Q2CBV6_OCEGH|nr:SDR family NAD(P)-dependent oxidoreductase [Oceanicola granulosus]EAR50164.1 oxidoreductase, short-chain dehydrogenase/reductase family protein [Oceanicola granulosus HTCC2516]
MRILVTGASRGIGSALMDIYEESDDEVLGTSRRGGDGLIQLDVTDPASLARLPGEVGGELDLLVCNAGIFPDRHERHDTGYPAAMWAEVFATNVTGVFLTVQALLPALIEAEGKIAILASQMGSSRKATGGAYIYRASKAAVLNLAKNLASDLEPDGIAVGAYHPGWVRTDMGGDGASLSPREAAEGLAERFDELDLHNTGCFETWNGTKHPF